MQANQLLTGYGTGMAVPFNKFVDCHNFVDGRSLSLAHKKTGFKMTDKKISGAFNVGDTYVACLFALIWLLDFFDLFGRTHAPEMLSCFACASLPLVKIASPLVADRLVSFSVEQCLNQPIHEPAASIIFFMGKISLTFLAALYYSFSQIERGFPEFQKRLSFYKERGGNIIDVIKYKMTGFIAFATIYVIILFPFKTLPTQYGIYLSRKGGEDFSTIPLLMCFVSFFDVLSACALYLKARKRE